MATDPQIALDKATAALHVLNDWIQAWKAQVRGSQGKSGVALSDAVKLPMPLFGGRELSEAYDSFTDVQRAEIFSAMVGLVFGHGSADTDTFTPKMAEFILAWSRKQLAATNNRCWEYFKAKDYREARAMSLYEARMGRDDEGADE